MSRVEIQPDQVMTVAGHIQSYGAELKKMAREVAHLFEDGISPELKNQVKGQFEALTSRLNHVAGTFDCLGSRTRDVAIALIQLDQGMAIGGAPMDT